jgi:hypothetical protein
MLFQVATSFQPLWSNYQLGSICTPNRAAGNILAAPGLSSRRTGRLQTIASFFWSRL